MKTNPNHWTARKSVCALVCAGSILGSAAHAQVDLNTNINFNPGTGIYTYSYGVLNKGPTFDLAIVNLNVATNSNLLNLSAPTGFNISFDPGVGVVSFLEDANLGTPQTFAPNSKTAPFTFTSTLAPVPIGFDALDAGANAFTGSALSAAPDSSAASNALVTGILSGNFTLTKNTTGNLTLTNANTYTGGTVLNAGTLAAGNGSAFGTGNLTVNGGTLRTSGGPLVVNIGAGNIVFTGGTYVANVGGTIPGVSHDQLTTTGSAAISGGNLTLVQQNNFLLQPGVKVTLVSAASGVAGGTAKGAPVPKSGVTGLAAFSNSPLLVPVVNLYLTSVVLETVQGSIMGLNGLVLSDGSSFNLTPNQQAVAGALDGVAALNNFKVGTVPALDFITSQSGISLSTIPLNLDLLAPEELTSIFTLGTALSGLQYSNLQRHFEEFRARGGSAERGTIANINSANLAGMSGPRGRGGKEIRPPRQMAGNERWGTFLIGSGNFTSVGSTANAAGYNLDTGGVTAGLEYKISDNFLLGIDAGYASTTARLVNGGKVDVDGGQFGIFASYFDMGFYVDAAVHGGVAGYKTRRTGLGGVATASPGGASFSALLAAGYDWKVGGLTVGPTVNFQYTNTRLDGFTETGSLAPLAVAGHNGESTRTAVGVRAFYDAPVGGVTVRPEVRVAWQHEYSETSYALTSSFATLGGNAFTVSGPNIGRDSLLVGAGVTVVWNNLLSTFIAYDGELARTNYESHSVSGGVKVAF